MKSAFRDEYVAMLKKYGVEYDPRYIFKTGDEWFPEYAAPDGALSGSELGSTNMSRLRRFRSSFPSFPSVKKFSV